MGQSGWIPSPVLSPGGEGHWREEGSGPCAEAASGAHGGCGGPEPWEPSARLHEVLAGGGGGGGHTSEGCQGPGPAKPEVPQDPDPRALLGPKPASDPASDPCLGPCDGPFLGPVASPRASPCPCPCGIPGPGLRAGHSPAGPHPGRGLEKGRTLAPEWREEPEQHQDTVGVAPQKERPRSELGSQGPWHLSSRLSSPSRVSPLHFSLLLHHPHPHFCQLLSF